MIIGILFDLIHYLIGFIVLFIIVYLLIQTHNYFSKNNMPLEYFGIRNTTTT
jgi:uncharacterized membrane protein YdcZ (DUF606 family)